MAARSLKDGEVGRLEGGFDVQSPFIQSLGFSLEYFDSGKARIRFAPQAQHLNSFAVTAGGALMTLLDASMAHAARSVARSMGVVTIEMKTSFMRPALCADGESLIGEAEVIQRTATMAFTQAWVRDSGGHICAHATGTFKFVRRLVAGDRQIHSQQKRSQ